MSFESPLSTRRSQNSDVTSWATDGPNGRVKITAYNPNEAGDLNQAPLVIIPGYTNGRATMKPLAEQAVEMGFRPITFSYERSTKPDTDPITHKVLTAEAVALSVMKKFSSTSIQLKGFSDGGNVAVELASHMRERDSELIDKVSLDAPLGIVTGSMLDAVTRGGREIARLMNPSDLRNIGRRTLICVQSIGYIINNPKLSFDELLAAQKVNTYDKISAMHEDGLPIGVMGLSHDSLFPADALRKSMPIGVPFTEIHGNHLQYLQESSIQDEALYIHKKLGDPPAVSVA
jgi:acetyl esterase/lipase